MSDALFLARLYAQEHPGEAAQVLENLPPEDTAAYLNELSPGDAVRIMEHLFPGYLVRCFAHSPAGQAAERLDLLSSFRACQVLRMSREDVRDSLLAHLPKKRQKLLKRQITFRPDTVGAWMSEAAPLISDEATVRDALDHARDTGPHDSHHLYVIQRDGGYVGAVEIHRLINEPPENRITQLLDARVETVLAQAPLASVKALAAWHHANALPVVNTANQVEGLLKAEDLQAASESAHPDTVNTSMFESLVPLFMLAATAWVRGMVALPFLESPKTPPKENNHDR